MSGALAGTKSYPSCIPFVTKLVVTDANIDVIDLGC